jgi:hypothetical protein
VNEVVIIENSDALVDTSSAFVSPMASSILTTLVRMLPAKLAWRSMRSRTCMSSVIWLWNASRAAVNACCI